MASSTAPTLWFAPPSATTNSASPAGTQFMSLFSDPSTWAVTASNCVGIVLTECFILKATDAQLTQIFDFLKANNLKLSMCTQMVPIQPNGIGNGQEGFATAAQHSEALQRISQLGGTLDLITMDQPLVAGHESTTGPGLTIPELAQQVATNVALAQSIFPNVQFEDDESLSTTADLGQWAQAFQQATGTSIVQFDADVNWALPNPQTSGLEAYAAAVRAAGATFNMIGDTATQQTNLSWTLAAEANIAAAEADPLIRPGTIQVNSWYPYPTVILPEGLDGTLSHVAVETAQFAPLYTSGYLVGGKGMTVSTAAPPPSYVGSAADAVAGAAVAIPGVQISVGGAPSASAGMTFAVVLTDVSGTLGATASGGGHVTGMGTDVLTLTGGLADINAELASLTYTGVAAGTDTIDVTTYDGVGLVDDHQIAVAVAAPISVPLPAGLGMAALYQNIFGEVPSGTILAAGQAALAAGQTLAQVAAPWIAQGQATIAALCEQVQGTSPTASVLASLTQALVGGESVAQIRASLAGSATMQSELAAFYQSHYGTAPTGSQLAALTQQLASGTSLEAVEAPLLANSQAEAQIASLYQQVEGQAPAASDLVTGARALLNGTPLATIRNQLAMSPLVQDNLAVLYQHVYDQTPTAAQLASLTAELAGTTTYAQVQAQLTASAQAEVTSIYQSALGRNPTVNELSKYTQDLISGTSTLSTILPGLAYSNESGANVTAMYHQVVGQAPPPAMVTKLEQCLCVGPSPIPLAELRTDLASAVTIYQQITGLTATSDALLPLMGDFLHADTISQIRYSLAYSAQENQAIGNSYQQLFGNAITGTALTNLKLALVAGTATMASIQSSLQAQAAADLPVISGVVANQAMPAVETVVAGQTATLDRVFAAVGIADPDPGAIETVTVSLSGGGSLAGGGTGTLNAAKTVYTAQGTAANVTVGLDKLTLVPATGGGATQLSLTVRNGAGNSTTATTAITSAASNTLVLQGGGNFDLTAPAVLQNVRVVDATEGQSAARPVITVGNGANVTLNLASAAATPELAGAVVHGALDNDVINLGSGNDTVYLGGPGETVNGGSGNDTFWVTSATLGAAIRAGSGTNNLEVQGGGSMVMGANITGIDGVFLKDAGTSYNFTANATPGLVIHAGADTDTIVVGSASQTVIGASGDLHVLATAANAGVAVKGGTGSNLLEITNGGTVTLNSADNNLTVQLDAASTLKLNHMQFIHAVGSGGNDVITAGAAGQVLTGGGGNDRLDDAGHYGVTFQDTVSGLSGDTLADFTKVDTIDLTGLSSAGASEIYNGTSSAGVLHVASGSSSVDINLSGQITGGSFHIASDTHGGMLITY
jgi:hypothetical protein